MYYRWTSVPAVDVLNSVGLRDGDIAEDGAVLVDGPSGEMDAFLLSRQLSAPTNSTDWDVVNSDFPREFALYVEFNASQYSGSIVAINRGMADEFNVALDTSSSAQMLIITLPGLDPVEIIVPPQMRSMFQIFGFKLENTILTVYVNCSLITILRLPASPQQLPISNSSVVEIFEQPTTVSWLHLLLNAIYSFQFYGLASSPDLFSSPHFFF